MQLFSTQFQHLLKIFLALTVHILHELFYILQPQTCLYFFTIINFLQTKYLIVWNKIGRSEKVFFIQPKYFLILVRSRILFKEKILVVLKKNFYSTRSMWKSDAYIGFHRLFCLPLWQFLSINRQHSYRVVPVLLDTPKHFSIFLVISASLTVLTFSFYLNIVKAVGTLT